MERAERRCGIIPKEIVEEILVKLPVKSLVRFKGVSKEWRGNIESSFFIEKHIEFQKSLEGKQARIVLLSSETRYNGLALDNLLVSDKGIIPVSPYLPIRSFNRFDGFKISEPCDGLFCIYTKTRIFNLVNPATTSRRRLPDPTSTVAHGRHMDYTLLGIGRENSVSGRYKLVWFFECDNEEMNESTRCKVFALDSNTWRYIHPPPHCRVFYRQHLIHLDGVMYCFSYSMENQTSVTLLAFDLHTETFQSFLITPATGSRYCFHELSMLVLNHRVCIFKPAVGVDDLFFKIWSLDINKRSWEMMYSIDLSCLQPEFRDWGIRPMTTINNYVIISNVNNTIWLLNGSNNQIVYPTSFSFDFFMSNYFETLVSTYQ